MATLKVFSPKLIFRELDNILIILYFSALEFTKCFFPTILFKYYPYPTSERECNSPSFTDGENISVQEVKPYSYKCKEGLELGF